MQKSLTRKCTKCQAFYIQLFIFLAGFFIVLMILIFLSTNIIMSKKTKKKQVLYIIIRYIHFLMLNKTYNLNVPGYFEDYIFYISRLSQVSTFWLFQNCLIMKFVTKNSYVIAQFLQFFTFSAICLFCLFYCKIKKIMKNYNKIMENIFIIIIPIYFDLFYSSIVCISIDNEKYLKITQQLNVFQRNILHY